MPPRSSNIVYTTGPGGPEIPEWLRSGLTWAVPGGARVPYTYQAVGQHPQPRMPIEYPVPPQNPRAAAPAQASPSVNPAVRAAAQAQPAPSQKGKRKVYIPSYGTYHDKDEVRELIRKRNEKYRNRNQLSSPEALRDMEKQLAQEEFSLLKQYNVNKHEPVLPSGFHGKPSKSKALEFYGGVGSEKGWKDMSPAERDARMLQENELRNTPERLARQQARQQEAQNREIEQQTQQQAARWAAMPPAERQQVIYNRQLADYNEAVERNQYIDAMPQQQQFGQQMGGPEMSPVMLNDLMQSIQGQNTRYVPMRPRRSIHDRVMSSFDPNMFSPEFIPEE